MLRKTILALALLCTATALSACYVGPGPGYGRCGGRGVIPAHKGPYGGFVPAHCA